MTSLRLRILAALAATGALEACGARTSTPLGNVDASVTDATPHDATADVTIDAGAVCPPQVKPSEQCFTQSELESLWYNPPFGGDPVDGGKGLPPFDPDGCLPSKVVVDGCCNSAANGPRYQNGTCCYTFCSSGCCGRPLVVDGIARVAGVVARGDWAAPTVTRHPVAALAALWLADARAEHASIASFARFALELLAVGAPPELVADAHRAALDEIEHARLCFALASRFGGAPIGPDTLDLAGVTPATDLATIAARAMTEGCVGETIAAALAAEQLAVAVDPEVRSALARIAADEEAHATLAWRFVAWAIARGGSSVRTAVAASLHAARHAFPEPPLHAAPEYGRLDPQAHVAAVLRARSEVVAPLAAALLLDGDAKAAPTARPAT